jgi:hypothetical protein
MKFLQIVVLATVLVASAHALKCNVATATKDATCPSEDLATSDTCYKCVTSSGVVTAGGCTGECATAKATCTAISGTLTQCKTDNCNGCSPASALQASAFMLVVAMLAMLF